MEYVECVTEAENLKCAIALAEGVPPFERATVVELLVSGPPSLNAAAAAASLLRQLQTFEFCEAKHLCFLEFVVASLGSTGNETSSVYLANALNNIVLAGRAGGSVVDSGLLCRIMQLSCAAEATRIAVDSFLHRLACHSREAARHLGCHCFPALAARVAAASTCSSSLHSLLQLVYAVFLRFPPDASSSSGGLGGDTAGAAASLWECETGDETGDAWEVLAGAVTTCLLRSPATPLESPVTSLAARAALVVAVWPPSRLILLLRRGATTGVARILLALLDFEVQAMTSAQSCPDRSSAAQQVILGALRTLAESDPAARAEAASVFLGGIPDKPSPDGAPSSSLPSSVVVALQSFSDDIRGALDETIFVICGGEVTSFVRVCGVALAAGRLVRSAGC
jgi:hypothetical protein